MATPPPGPPSPTPTHKVPYTTQMVTDQDVRHVAALTSTRVFPRNKGDFNFSCSLSYSLPLPLSLTPSFFSPQHSSVLAEMPGGQTTSCNSVASHQNLQALRCHRAPPPSQKTCLSAHTHAQVLKGSKGQLLGVCAATDTFQNPFLLNQCLNLQQ